MTKGPCWICRRTIVRRYHWDMDNEAISADCRVCGSYRVGIEAQALRASAGELMPYLAAHIRQSPGVGRFEVATDWPQTAEVHARSTLSQKVRLLLEWLANRTKPGGWEVIFLDELAPLIDAQSENEALFLLEHLSGLKHIRHIRQDVTSEDRAEGAEGHKYGIWLEFAGWEAVSPVAGAGVTGVCFVAMSFATSLDEAYEKGMIPAIEDDCKFKVVRLDRVEHNDDISDRILAGIRSAQFVVADFTQHRPSVYYEAGFAEALGRTVISTCREDDVKNLHFDTRQKSHVVWTTPQDLRTKLTQRIRATVSLPARLG